MRPRSGAVCAPCRSRRRMRPRSSFEPQLGFTHTDDVPAGQAVRPVGPNSVHVRPVRRVQIDHPDPVPARIDANAARGRELVAPHPAIVPTPPPSPPPHAPNLHLPPPPQLLP